MELGRLLVDKKGVGNPDQLDVVRTNDKLVNSGLNKIDRCKYLMKKCLANLK